MTNDVFAFERECDAARDRWAKLTGNEIAEVIDHCGDGEEAIAQMLYLARKNFISDAYQVLFALKIRSRVDTAQELRDFIATETPEHVALFDRYARLAAEELKLDEAWIEGEAELAIKFPDNGQDRAFDEARDEGRI